MDNLLLTIIIVFVIAMSGFAFVMYHVRKEDRARQSKR